MKKDIDLRKKRTLIEKEVIIKNIIKAEALDISSEGMYIYTQADVIEGAIFEISFKIDNHNIKAMVKAQHVEPHVGVGVKFVDISDTDSNLIKKFVES
ncbi:MAG: PilZ domain-containing protein [Nitrospiraceae bacterium]|nr:PilZ domain-containing protein [Nitrospiraceae bacterium]